MNSNLELFSFIWLDSNLEIKDNRFLNEQLRSIINYVKKFEDIDECERYIQQTSSEDRLVMIVSGSQGQHLLPRIHRLRQITSIYVFCMDESKHKKWTEHFFKIKFVTSQLNDLIDCIKRDQTIWTKIQEPLSYHSFHTNDDQSTSELNGKFLYSQLLFDCILQIKPNDKDKIELIALLKQQHVDNAIEIANIDDFDRNYCSEKIVEQRNIFLQSIKESTSYTEHSYDLSYAFIYQ